MFPQRSSLVQSYRQLLLKREDKITWQEPKKPKRVERATSLSNTVEYQLITCNEFATVCNPGRGLHNLLCVSPAENMLTPFWSSCREFPIFLVRTLPSSGRIPGHMRLATKSALLPLMPLPRFYSLISKSREMILVWQKQNNKPRGGAKILDNRVSARSSVQLPFMGFFCIGPLTHSLTTRGSSVVAHTRGRLRKTKTFGSLVNNATQFSSLTRLKDIIIERPVELQILGAGQFTPRRKHSIRAPKGSPPELPLTSYMVSSSRW